MRLPKYLVEVRTIPWEMSDEFGHHTYKTMAQEIVSIRVVNPSSAKTYIRNDGYGDFAEWMVQTGNKDWIQRITNRIDYTGGHVWRSRGVYPTDDPFHQTKHRVFIDPSRVASAKLVMGGKPITKDQAKKFMKPLDKWFEV